MHISAVTAVTKGDITALGIPAQDTNTTYTLASLGAAAKSIVRTGNLSTSWSGSAAPYTQTVTVSGVTASNNIVVSIGSGATAQQLDAWGAGKIMATEQAANSVTFKAFGDKPTIALPYSVVILG